MSAIIFHFCFLNGHLKTQWKKKHTHTEKDTQTYLTRWLDIGHYVVYVEISNQHLTRMFEFLSNHLNRDKERERERIETTLIHMKIPLHLTLWSRAHLHLYLFGILDLRNLFSKLNDCFNFKIWRRWNAVKIVHCHKLFGRMCVCFEGLVTPSFKKVTAIF